MFLQLHCPTGLFLQLRLQLGIMLYAQQWDSLTAFNEVKNDTSYSLFLQDLLQLVRGLDPAALITNSSLVVVSEVVHRTIVIIIISHNLSTTIYSTYIAV